MLPLHMRVSHVLCISFLICTTSAQGQIAQFLDASCDEKSPINPTVSLPIDTCLVTSGTQGVVIQLLPKCLTGNVTATLQLYNDQLCAIPDSTPNDNQDNCIWWYGGSDIPAIMFICGSVADGDSDATSTTTVTAGSVLVPVAKATGATTTSTSGCLSSQTADSNGIFSSATPSSSASVPSQTNASSDGGDSSSGLSQHDQIVLGIVIPVAAILVALLAWLCPKPWNKGGGEGLQNDYRMLHYPVAHHIPQWHRG